LGIYLGENKMKYIYINTQENKVTTISRKPLADLDALVEYRVSDDFDLTKEMPSMENEGEMVRLEGFLSAEEFLERFESNYSENRIGKYPPIEDQLDMIYHAGLGGDEFQATIKAVKDAHPKPTGE